MTLLYIAIACAILLIIWLLWPGTRCPECKSRHTLHDGDAYYTCMQCGKQFDSLIPDPFDKK